MNNHQEEFHFSRHNVLALAWRGVLVGIVSGCVVSLFRLLIEKIFEKVSYYYQIAQDQPVYLLPIGICSVIIVVFIGLLVKSDKDIKGSGIPHVEGELKGDLETNWWSILWKKFIGGVLSISMGLMLGREGPSIQLGAMSAKGIAHFLKACGIEKRVLIASGAAAGLSAAFNAPIAGLLFVVEEVYHHFSHLVWVTALVASLVANYISLHIFGLTPVLAMPGDLPYLPLSQYWIFLLLGIFLGIMGYIYEKVILNINVFYDFLGKLFHVPSYFYGIFAVLLTLPVAYFYPQLLGGGNSVINSLSISNPTLATVVIYLTIRFILSMISYGSGLPGGIFLPILTLGSLSGLAFGLFFENMQLLNAQSLPLFIVLGMSGYFGAISKAPLTAMILVTEMVGDLGQLMIIGIVTIVAYLMMDLLKGEPIYEAMLAKLTNDNKKKALKPTLLEFIVTEKLAGKLVRDLTLPKNVLITTQIHNQEAEVVSGNTRLHSGDTIFLVVNESDIGKVQELFL